MLDAMVVAAGSLVIGILGGLLGVGGGVFLVPFLVFFTDLRPVEAVGLSLFCVMGTSVGTSKRNLVGGHTNIGLALFLEPFMVAGSIGAALFAQKIRDQSLMLGFAGLMLFLGALFLRKAPASSERVQKPTGAPRLTDGETLEPDGAPLAYRPAKLPLLGALVFGTGAASGLFGIGGGSINVPLMTLLSRVPLRAAAATSTFTMSVTGAAGGIVHLSHGTVPVALVAATLAGVVPGGQIGATWRHRFSETTLRRAFAALALLVAVASFFRARSMG